MDTPAGHRRAAPIPVLYGEGCRLINRRSAAIGLLTLSAAPGLALTRRVRALSWSGRAHVEVGGRTLELQSQTHLALPLLQVRSTSWIVADGPATARTMILAPDGQWVERDGVRTPLAAAIGIHERQQYAIYGWLAEVQRLRRRPGPLALSAPPWPDIAFTIGADGFPTDAVLTVDAPEPDKPRIVEHVALSGRLDSHGVRWPARFEITQDGRPYFTLAIDRFEASV